MRYGAIGTALSGLGLGSVLLAGLTMPNPKVQTPQSQTPASDSEWNRSTAEKAIHRHINSMRQAREESALMWREPVADAAREYARKIADAGQLTHTLNGSDPIQRYQRVGIAGFNGENINQTLWDRRFQTKSGVKKITTVDELSLWMVQQWFESPSHRRNVMRPDNNAQGIGVARSGSEVYAVQVFTR
jgi:uncharacterized protein YkwD